MQVLVNVGIAVYYNLNKAYITQKLCENRNNPKLHCNGHCFLSKQLKKAEEGAQKQSQNIVKEKEEIISCQLSALPHRYFPNYVVTSLLRFHSGVYSTSIQHTLLKPPAA